MSAHLRISVIYCLWEWVRQLAEKKKRCPLTLAVMCDNNEETITNEVAKLEAMEEFSCHECGRRGEKVSFEVWAALVDEYEMLIVLLAFGDVPDDNTLRSEYMRAGGKEQWSSDIF